MIFTIVFLFFILKYVCYFFFLVECFERLLLIRELIVSCVMYGTCQIHHARITYEVVSQDIRRESANSICIQTYRGYVYSLRHLHISMIRLYVDIRACTVKHICTCTARVKSVRINWQTLNSLYVYELCTYTTSDEMLFQVGKNASDQKHRVFEMPYFITSYLLFKYNE